MGKGLKKRKRGEPVELIAELQMLRKEAHDIMSKAEYWFFQVDRALLEAEKIKRYREAGNDVG